MKCSKCRWGIANFGFKMCEDCRRKGRNRLAKRKLKGLCRSCPNAPIPGEVFCSECKPVRGDVPEGICTACVTRDARPGMKTCAHCAKDHQLRYKENKALGLCIRNCGRRSVPGKTQCQVCLDTVSKNHKATREERAKAGICINHKDRPVAPGNKTQCVECKSRGAKAYKLKQQRLREANANATLVPAIQEGLIDTRTSTETDHGRSMESRAA